MTPIQINYLMIAFILAGLGMVWSIYAHVQRFSAWIIPILLLLLHGLFYSVVYIVDASNGGITTPMTYNLWNNVLRGQTYLTVIAYAAAFQIMQGRITQDG